MSRSSSKSEFVCERCGLPLQIQGDGWRHAVNVMTKYKACGAPVPVKRGARPLRAGDEITVWRPAGVVTLNKLPRMQRFRAGSFDHAVGATWPVKRKGAVVAYAVVASVEVPTDGSGVLFRLEVLDSSEEEAA